MKNVNTKGGSPLFYVVKNPTMLTSKRQSMREAFMQSMAEQGTLAPSDFTPMANRWWPGTNPTKYENS